MLDLQNGLWYYKQAVASETLLDGKRQPMLTERCLKIEQKEIRQNNSYFESFCQNL